MSHDDRDPHPPEALPPELIRSLRALDARPAAVDPAVDAAIRSAIHGRFAAIRRRRSRWRRWPAGLAAAAALVLAVVLVSQEEPGTSEPRARAVANDLDGNGRVDVLDAFLLARTLAAEATAPERFDVDGDGVVDRRDADRLATLAVRLPDD